MVKVCRQRGLVMVAIGGMSPSGPGLSQIQPPLGVEEIMSWCRADALQARCLGRVSAVRPTVRLEDVPAVRLQVWTCGMPGSRQHV